MSYLWTILVIFWIIIIYNPALISYLIWGFMIFVWLNIVITKYFFFKKSNNNWKDYVSFWKYKIYKD